MPSDKVERTLDALVDEAYRIAVDRGIAINSIEGWKRWKRATYIETAKREGPGYLRRHYERLGLAEPREPEKCAACSARINGLAVRRVDDDPTPYCSNDCAGVETVTLAEYLEKLPPEKRDNMLRFLKRKKGSE